MVDVFRIYLLIVNNCKSNNELIKSNCKFSKKIFIQSQIFLSSRYCRHAANFHKTSTKFIPPQIIGRCFKQFQFSKLISNYYGCVNKFTFDIFSLLFCNAQVIFKNESVQKHFDPKRAKMREMLLLARSSYPSLLH